MRMMRGGPSRLAAGSQAVASWSVRAVLPLVSLLAFACPVSAQQSSDLVDVQARLAREEAAQKRAQNMTDRAAAELAELLDQIQAHRLKPSGELLSVDPAHKTISRISKDDIPKVATELYLARTAADALRRAKAVAASARQQEQVVKQLQTLLAGLNRSAMTGASLHRAERILRDQTKLNAAAKVSLAEGIRMLGNMTDALRQKLVVHSEEQVRIGREVVLLDAELTEAEKSGSTRQQSGIKAARRIIAEKKLTVLAQEVADQLVANNAAAATGGAELETHFKTLVAALQAATAGAEFVEPFDLLGPSLADLAAKDKELAELLAKLKAMIREAQLMKRPPQAEELRKLANMQQELNNMLVEINRNMPDMTDVALLARLKEMLSNALAAMAEVGQGLSEADMERILEELKVTLGHLVLAEEELKALLATLAALQAGQGQKDDNARETPAGIALGLGIRLGGNTTGASGPGGALNAARKARDLGPQDWGRLPPAVREQLLNAVKENYPPEYADLIELYFQNIAKGANGK